MLFRNREPSDLILVESLLLRSRVGVTQEERALPQELALSLTMSPRQVPAGVGDQLANTVDYAAVCAEAQAVAARGERQLLETLAEEIAAMILERFAVESVVVELRKPRILGAASVGVRIKRPL